jgi:hypothetical protein
MSHLAWETLGVVVVVSALLVVVSSGHHFYVQVGTTGKNSYYSLARVVPFLFRHLFLSQQAHLQHASRQARNASRIADTYITLHVL